MLEWSCFPLLCVFSVLRIQLHAGPQLPSRPAQMLTSQTEELSPLSHMKVRPAFQCPVLLMHHAAQWSLDMKQQWAQSVLELRVALHNLVRCKRQMFFHSLLSVDVCKSLKYFSHQLIHCLSWFHTSQCHLWLKSFWWSEVSFPDLCRLLWGHISRY